MKTAYFNERKTKDERRMNERST